MKLSKNKATLPGRKQVYRIYDANGRCNTDIIALADEEPLGTALLTKVMANGKILVKQPPLDQIRMKAKENLSNLPKKYLKITKAPTYPVKLSKGLKELLCSVRKRLSVEEF